MREDRERHILYDLSYVWTRNKAKLTQTESRVVISRGWRVDKMGRHW